MNIYGSREVFVNEYRSLLADRLLQSLNYDISREVLFCGEGYVQSLPGRMELIGCTQSIGMCIHCICNSTIIMAGIGTQYQLTK